MKRPTVADIARHAGVSKGAVSYALNGRPGVSAATRERIIGIARDLGFSPSNAARTLSRASSRMVGMTLSRPAHVLCVEPWFMELISGFEQELSARSYALTLQGVAGPDEEIEVHRRWWGEGRIDGVIVTDLMENDPRIPALRRLQLPAVVIGGPSDTGGVAQLWSDDAESMSEAIRYLAAIGHRRIARVSGPARLLHTQARTRAFVECSATLGLNPAVTVEADYTGEGGRLATRRLLAGSRRPSAIVYDNDVMAVVGLAVAQEMCIDVPAKLSIVSWDDSVLCRLVHPALTALTRDIVGYGRDAAQALLRAVDSGHLESREGARAHLTPRGSTAPPR